MPKAEQTFVLTMGTLIFLLPCAWADAAEQSSLAPRAAARRLPPRNNRSTSSSGVPLRKQGNWPSGSA